MVFLWHIDNNNVSCCCLLWSLVSHFEVPDSLLRKKNRTFVHEIRHINVVLQFVLSTKCQNIFSRTRKDLVICWYLYKKVLEFVCTTFLLFNFFFQIRYLYSNDRILHLFPRYGKPTTISLPKFLKQDFKCHYGCKLRKSWTK